MRHIRLVVSDPASIVVVLVSLATTNQCTNVVLTSLGNTVANRGAVRTDCSLFIQLIDGFVFRDVFDEQLGESGALYSLELLISSLRDQLITYTREEQLKSYHKPSHVFRAKNELNTYSRFALLSLSCPSEPASEC